MISSCPSNETKSKPMAAPEKRRRLIQCGEGMPSFNGAAEDVDDVQDSEHFDVRESFLSLCQGNHYQFDQLRRAKHSSMMVLYHLHNPDVPKFLHRCNHCHVDILGGFKYYCESCDMDFCGGCLKTIGKAIHPSPCHLRLIAPNSSTRWTQSARAVDSPVHELAAAHHWECSSADCRKMKVSVFLLWWRHVLIYFPKTVTMMPSSTTASARSGQQEGAAYALNFSTFSKFMRGHVDLIAVGFLAAQSWSSA